MTMKLAWMSISDYLIHDLFYLLGKIRTSSPGPGTVWLYPPQPFSTPVHASGRDHFKADSAIEVEAIKKIKSYSRFSIHSDNWSFYPHFKMPARKYRDRKPCLHMTNQGSILDNIYSSPSSKRSDSWAQSQSMSRTLQDTTQLPLLCLYLTAIFR